VKIMAARKTNLAAVPEEVPPKTRARATRAKVSAGKPPAKRAQSRRRGKAIDIDDERETLIMLRTTLKKKIDDAPTHAIAAIVKQFRDVDREIRAIDAKAAQQAEEDGDDDGDDEGWSDDDL
jgi:hypothetical protein